MDQRPNSTNTTNTASLELLPLFKESKEQEDESIIRRKRSSSCFVDQPSKMSRSKLLYKAVFFQGCRFSSSWKRKDVRKILKRKVSDAGEKDSAPSKETDHAQQLKFSIWDKSSMDIKYASQLIFFG
ncbi:hypothetical protein Ahy_A10g049155 isoform A [Arachis hypogaea]|uniref:Uncharacterized protein n=1 Tax=Arachis hypogaea TaxID=3818 RepID=A0A445B6L3_ARAHY|nr:hypothetical protein Ahy_A10g049155 isoform A [Arachis hypogaea]